MDSLSALGLGVSDLGRYLDVASQAQSKSNTTATDLLTAYVGVGGTLKNLNIGLEESATWLGVLANRGVKGSEAGNALSAVLINLTSGAGQAGGALEDLGVSAFDSNGTFKGLEVVLKELDTALSNVTEEEKNAYLAMIGGKEHIGDLNALIDGLNGEYSELSASITDSNGRLNEMTDIMSTTSKMGIDELMGKLESLGIKIGDSLMPSFDSIVTGATNIVDNFATMDEGVQESVVNFGLLTVASVPVLKIVSSLTEGLSMAAGGFGKLSEAISTGQLLSSLTSLGSTLGTVALVGGAGALTGGALYGLWKGFQSVYEVSEWTSKGVLSNSEYLRMIEEPAAQAKIALEQLTSEFETMYNKTGEILTNTIEINRALNEQQYQDTVNSYTKTHEGVIGTLEERRAAELEIIKGMYDDRILNAQLLSEAELQAVQAEKQAMVDATNSRIDEMVNIEKIGYERVMSDAKMAQDEMYAGNATFTQNMLAQREEYQNNVSVITETGNAYVKQLQEQNDASMLELTYQFKNDYTKNASDMYTQIAQLAETNRQSELAAEATSYQEKINKYGEYQDSYFTSLGTTKKEYLSNLKTQHEDANAIIENGYQNDITKLNNANSERQNVLALNAEAEYELITQNQKLTEDETNQYYGRVKELYDTGETDNAKIIEDALEEILNNRKTNYSDLERTQSTHSTAYENETLNMWKDVARKTSTGTSDVMREMDRLKDKKVYVDTYFRTFGSAQASGSYSSAKSSSSYSTYSLIPEEMSTFGVNPISDNINNSLEIAEVSPFAVNSYDANATLNDSLSNYQRMIGNKSTDSMLETLKKQTTQQQKQIELLTQLALNGANNDSKIVIENLSVRSDNDIRMLAVELENLRKLEAISRGDN